jgi:hypothetical protein
MLNISLGAKPGTDHTFYYRDPTNQFKTVHRKIMNPLRVKKKEKGT